MRTGNDARIRFFFDITFFIIVTTIGLNIVFGIIVDTFSELRDLKVNALNCVGYPTLLELILFTVPCSARHEKYLLHLWLTKSRV